MVSLGRTVGETQTLADRIQARALLREIVCERGMTTFAERLGRVEIASFRSRRVCVRTVRPRASPCMSLEKREHGHTQ